MYETQNKDTNHVKCQADQEHEEVSVVPPTNAIVDPGAVVVKYLNTIVTHTTVTTSRRSVELTCHTPLHTNLKHCSC